MENRSLSVVACLIACLLGGPALATDGAASVEQQADWRQRQDKAAALQAEGQTRQKEADRVFKEKSIDCQKKFLVNACLKEVDDEYSLASRQAKQLENEGQAIERQVRKEELSDQDLRHQAAVPQRAAELQRREAETAATRDAAEARETAIRADKAKKAEEGARRRKEQAEKQQQKQAAHEARVAEKMLKAQQQTGGAGAAAK